MPLASLLLYLSKTLFLLSNSSFTTTVTFEYRGVFSLKQRSEFILRIDRKFEMGKLWIVEKRDQEMERSRAAQVIILHACVKCGPFVRWFPSGVGHETGS